MQRYRFINSSNQLNMFRAIISPILRSTDSVYSLWYNELTMLLASNLDEVELFHLIQVHVGALYHKL